MGCVALETVVEGSWVEEESAEVSPGTRSAGYGVVLATESCWPRPSPTPPLPALPSLSCDHLLFVLISKMGTMTSTCVGLVTGVTNIGPQPVAAAYFSYALESMSDSRH